MDFQTAVRTCLKKYVTFSGRATRPEYWWFVLFGLLGQIVFGVIDNMLFHTGRAVHGPGFFSYSQDGGPLGGLFSLAIFLPMLSVAVRRLHDLDKSGWWLLISFVPLVGFLVLLYFFVQPSQPGANRFGGQGAPANPWGPHEDPPSRMT